MENVFGLKVGMQTSQVLQNIERANVNSKVKQVVINFCNKDKDATVTNDVELAMLNSWFNNSEKIKMPPKEPSGAGWNTENGKSYVRFSQENSKEIYETQTYDDRPEKTTVWKKYLSDNHDGYLADETDMLVDSNNDGYADHRIYSLYNKNTGTSTSYYDNNLDGMFDVSSVEDDDE